MCARLVTYFRMGENMVLFMLPPITINSLLHNEDKIIKIIDISELING
jgi:hypothetical protein